MIPPEKKCSKSKQIALGGMFSSLSLCIMLVSGFLPVSTFTAPVFAGLCLLPIVWEIGTATAFVMYLTVSGLSFLLIPDYEMTLFFILLFGHYPILRPYLNKIRVVPLRFFCKIAVFNIAAIAATFIFLYIFAAPAVQKEFFDEMLVIQIFTLLLGNVTFIIYDALIAKLHIVYNLKFRKYFFKK